MATIDAKVINAYSYKIAREDHTLGNLMRMCVRVQAMSSLTTSMASLAGLHAAADFAHYFVLMLLGAFFNASGSFCGTLESSLQDTSTPTL